MIDKMEYLPVIHRDYMTRESVISKAWSSM